MYSLENFIVDVGEPIEKAVTTEGGIVIEQDTTDDQFLTKTKRYGVVLSVPEGEKEIKVGNKIYFHHNITRQSRANGKIIESGFHIKDGKYIVPPNMVVGYVQNKNKTLRMYKDNVFIKPEDKNDTQRKSGIWIPGRRVQMVGEVAVSNKELKKQDVYAGDAVGFARDSEYRFWIDGNEFYRMKTSDILIKLNGKEKEKYEGVYSSKTDRVKQKLSDGTD